MNLADRKLLIVGASARAAAFSARRAGLVPWAADLFADRDLALACADFRRVEHYPHGFLEISRRGPAGPWMYTGALENAPGLVEEISRHRPLWGNTASVLRRVRCPITISRVLREHDIACPAVLEGAAMPETGRWLLKPKAGASGRGISFCADSHEVTYAGCLLQEYIEGEPHSVVYVAAGGQCQLLGMTRQLVGETWLHARPFRYCGSIGPLEMSLSLHGALTRLGQVLASTFDLRGLFGVDFILRDDVPWPVEINPRYTASVEVLEWATGQSALAKHAQAFEDGRAVWLVPAAPTTRTSPAALGKAIYYAAAPLCCPQDGPWDCSFHEAWDAWRIPDYADIPTPGQLFALGQPVLTFFAPGETVVACRENLKRMASDLDRLLSPR